MSDLIVINEVTLDCLVPLLKKNMQDEKKKLDNTGSNTFRDKLRERTAKDLVSFAAEYGLDFDGNNKCINDPSLSIGINKDGYAFYNDFGGVDSGGDCIWLLMDYLPQRQEGKKYSIEEALKDVSSFFGINAGLDMYFDPNLECYLLKKENGIQLLKKQSLVQVHLSSMGTKVDFKQIPIAERVYEPKEEDVFYKNNTTYINAFHDKGLLFLQEKSKGTHPYVDKLLKSLIPSDEHRRYFINWLACFYQTLQKSQVTYVFHGVQGSGKTLLVNLIFNIFGKENSIVVSDTELNSQFNAWADNKLFINFNEVDATNHKKSVRNELKGLITDDTLLINNKNIKMYRIKNQFNTIFSSNESLPIQIEDTDRRYNVLYTPIKLESLDWFDSKTYEKILLEDKEFAKTLASYPIRKEEYNKLFESKSKKQMKELSKDDDELFVSKLFKEQDKEFFDQYDIGIDIEYIFSMGYINNQELETIYNDYLFGKGVDRYQISINSITSKLSRLGLPKSKTKKINGNTVKVRYLKGVTSSKYQ